MRYPALHKEIGPKGTVKVYHEGVITSLAKIPPYKPVANQLVPIPIVKSRVPEHNLVGGGACTLYEYPVYVWYVKGPSQNILWDAGVSAKAWGKAFPTEPIPSNADPADSLTPALAKLGLEPKEIDFVALSHNHEDHVYHWDLFTNAKFIVSQPMYEEIMDPGIYNPYKLPHDKGSLSKLQPGKWQVIKDDSQLAEGVWVIQTPGHAVGGQSLMLDTIKGRLVLSGLCSTLANWPEGKDPIRLALSIDERLVWDSQMRTIQLADIIVAPHDPKYIDGQPIG